MGNLAVISIQMWIQHNIFFFMRNSENIDHSVQMLYDFGLFGLISVAYWRLESFEYLLSKEFHFSNFY